VKVSRAGRRAALAAVTAAAASLMLAVPAMASTAQASRGTPVVQAGYRGWDHMTRRPAKVAAVSPAGTGVRHIHWQYWGNRTAYGRGWPALGCPSYGNPRVGLRVGILFYRVRTHDGVRYFSRMKLSCHDTAPGQPAQHVWYSFEDRAQVGWYQTYPA
jgi:hypothetical protein